MDLEKQKRNQLIRVVLTEILMVLAIIPIVVLLTLLAMGYRLGDDLSLEQSGLLQVNSIPNGAMVKIDGEDKFRTDASRMLTGGEHSLEISKEGYDSWFKTVEITPGILLRVRYPRLFKQNRETEVVGELSGLKMFSIAPNRTRLIYQLNTSPRFKLMNIRGDEPKTSELDLSSILNVNEAGEFVGVISQTRWSWNGDAVLLKISYGETIEWVLVDMRESVPNRNLTKDFGLAISDVQFAGDSTERIYILENRNLREINLGSNGISKVLLPGVEKFYAEQDYVGYVGLENNERVVGLYHNGDDGGVVAAKLENNIPAHVAISSYYGERYLSWTAGDKLVIYEGENFPAYGGDFKRMRKIIDADTGIQLTQPLVVNRTGEVIIARNNNVVVAVDLETKKYDKYEAVSGTMSFIDDYLLCGVKDSVLYVWDFDGENQRVLAKNAAQYPAIVSTNSHWLYYILNAENKVSLVRERIN